MPVLILFLIFFGLLFPKFMRAAVLIALVLLVWVGAEVRREARMADCARGVVEACAR